MNSWWIDEHMFNAVSVEGAGGVKLVPFPFHNPC